METRHFIENIEGHPDITVLGSAYEDGFHTNHYQGPSNIRVIVDTTDDDIPDDICKEVLRELGLPHLIDLMFPPRSSSSFKVPIVDDVRVPDSQTKG